MNKYLVRGLGFFNDAYDLFVMNIINVVLTEQYGKHVYTSYVKSWVSAAAIIGAVIGQLLFGVLGDIFGRRVNMTATCVLLIVGSILCTVAYGGDGSATLWFLPDNQVQSRGDQGEVKRETEMAAADWMMTLSSVE
ncbi:hypothetical protein PHYSODRAFT_337220 [Phytophthora sojae]|uniref:Major facilitator superfamily (MFS) profile domain-containing protein n=1 Tax=Phytophthora sojae (strain P6497) TaxID=1094619 RepID=G4ZZQ3_PHYSP|nr:hypothetical protein PHYSODRAFT_337220 [Phytophthora sojae]EGZ10399.1 hypothetical protein PHYSODRAFT_337220 [Phytophthora sojae]|eukprot:XP_009533144.1 hypothetical protein PHYSODRAFT_337220 [Phytophthora sojae]